MTFNGFLQMAAAPAVAMMLTGCASLVSLNPFVTNKEAVLDAGLPGVWKDAAGEETYVVRQDGPIYSITYLDKSSTVKLEGRLLAAGDAEFLDLVSANDDPFQLPVHTMLRIWIDGGVLRMAFLDSAWLKERAVRELPTGLAKDRLLITAPGDAVRKFLLRYGADERAHGEPAELRRAN